MSTTITTARSSRLNKAEGSPITAIDLRGYAGPNGPLSVVTVLDLGITE